MLSNGIAILDLDVDGGTVTADRASLIRRNCSLTLTDPTGTLVASTARQMLTPYGNEFSVYTGVQFDDGTQELVLQGIFAIVDCSVDDTGVDLVITLDGADRSRWVQRDVFADVFTIPPNTNVGLAIQSIILSRNIPLIAQQFNFAPTAFTTPATPLTYTAGTDPLQSCVDLAAGIGCELFLDPNGIWTLIPIPDPRQGAISWPYDEGPNSIVVEMIPVVSSAVAYNKVVCELAGTSAGATPIQGIAEDDDPTSKTWVGGSYGEVVHYKSSSQYSNKAQAQVDANATLLTDLGTLNAMTFSALVKPDTDVDDVIEASRVRAGIAPGSTYVIDSFTIDLGPGGLLNGTCRGVNV